MSGKEFVGVVAPSQARSSPARPFLTFMVKDFFALPTLLALGAAIQSLLFIILPSRLAVLPLFLLIGWSIIHTIVDSTRGVRNTYMERVVQGRTSAQLPNPDTGVFGSTPAAKEVVVLHLGVRFNHPLGPFCPGGKETISGFQACVAELNTDPDGWGLLGTSTWRANERANHNTLLVMLYFRDLDGLNKFANSGIHREVWNRFAKGGHRHISIFHEAFAVPAKSYESIYVNCEPLLLGATSVKCEIDELEDKSDGELAQKECKWVDALVAANTPALKTQYSRMGQGYRDAQRENEAVGMQV